MMSSENVIYQLAIRPFQDGHSDLATLANFVDKCIESPPLDPLPDAAAYLEVLPENVEWSQQTSLSFYNYITILTLLIAELWDDEHLIALGAARNLWEIGRNDVESAAQTRVLLPALASHSACTRSPDTHALITGLRGLFDLCETDRELNIETVEFLDEGLAFPNSGFSSQQLQELLLNSEMSVGKNTPPTWNELVAHIRSDAEQVRQILIDIYPRAFFALRYRRMADDYLKGEHLKAIEVSCEGVKEILSTPGAEYLTTNDLERLRAEYIATNEGLLGLLQSCIHLLNRAEALLYPTDPWSLTYLIHISAAKVRLRAFKASQQEDLIRSGRRFVLRAAWRVRWISPLLLNNARNLLAKIYQAWNKADRAHRCWAGMLRSIGNRPYDASILSIVATANAAMGELAMESGDFPAAKEYCLTAISQSDINLESDTLNNHLSLEEWDGYILDNTISACAATSDSAAAVEVFERWYRASELIRHLGLQPANIEAIQDMLDNGSAIVYIATSKQGISLVVVLKDDAKAYLMEDFNWQDLQTALGPWFKAVWRMRNTSQSQTLESLRIFQEAMNITLSQLTPVVRSTATLLTKHGVHRAVMIPGRGLGSLPLHAIPLDMDKEDGGRFGDVVDILYAPNATVWLRATLAQSERCHEQRFDAFSTSDIGFSLELIQAAALWGDTNPPHVDASASDFLQIVAETGILHVSCHGWFWVVDDRTKGLDVDTGLDLGGERLEWRDLLDKLRLPCARLVVLSACESLLLSHRDVLNQQFGLPYAFLAAGAPLLLGTNWRVEATATALLVTRFHENIVLKKLLSSRGLTEAQVWLRKLSRIQVKEALVSYFGREAEGAWIPEGKHPYGHPYWWAGFRLIGADLQ
jgi:CHAT domain-containing protein